MINRNLDFLLQLLVNVFLGMRKVSKSGDDFLLCGCLVADAEPLKIRRF